MELADVSMIPTAEPKRLRNVDTVILEIESDRPTTMHGCKIKGFGEPTRIQVYADRVAKACACRVRSAEDDAAWQAAVEMADEANRVWDEKHGPRMRGMGESEKHDYRRVHNLVHPAKFLYLKGRRSGVSPIYSMVVLNPNDASDRIDVREWLELPRKEQLSSRWSAGKPEGADTGAGQITRLAAALGEQNQNMIAALLEAMQAQQESKPTRRRRTKNEPEEAA